MSEEKKITEEELLYDPMFAQKPVLDWTDSEKGGIFGKSIVKKTIFIIILLIAIGGSLFISFNSISKDRFEFKQLDDGTYKLESFSGQKYDTVLNVDYVRDEKGKPDTSKPVTAMRQFTATGNDTLQFVFIGKDVKDIEKTSFFYCTALCAVFVDDANPYYMDIDGVLYRKEKNVPIEAVLCPQQYTRYLTVLSMGDKAPTTPAEATNLANKMAKEEFIATVEDVIESENTKVGKTYTIPDTVTKIDQLAFAYCDKFISIKLPKALKEIEAMAFFKCTALKNIELPDGLEKIGADAFSKCENWDYIFIPASVTSIGHNAFWECKAAEKVYMAAENLNGIETGAHWIPQYRKTFMKNRDIQFGAERGVK